MAAAHHVSSSSVQARKCAERIQKGLVHHRCNRLQEAHDCYQAALSIDGRNFDALHLCGVVEHQMGHDRAALILYRKALEISSVSAALWTNLGNSQKRLRLFEDALESYERALRIKPDHIESLYNCATLLATLGRDEDAVSHYDQALLIDSNFAEAWNNRGASLFELSRFDEALVSYDQALVSKPDYAEAMNNRGVCLNKLKRFEEALVSYQEALRLNPTYAEALSNSGDTLKELSRLDESLLSYDAALRIKPDYPSAHNNRGNVLYLLQRFDESIAAYDEALGLRGDYAEAYFNRGVAFSAMFRHEEATTDFARAVHLNPELSEAYSALGVALSEPLSFRLTNDLEEAICSLLTRRDSVRPISIANQVINLLNGKPEVASILLTRPLEVNTHSIEGMVACISEQHMLLALMSVSPLPDLTIEKFLRDLRECLLRSISLPIGLEKFVAFQSALALHCFTNEYIYHETAEERVLLRQLSLKIEQCLLNGVQPEPKEVLCLASYKALHECSWCEMLIGNEWINDVYVRQVSEPRTENYLAQTMTSLGTITDEISLRVRDQYEHNPYPRWINLGLSATPQRVATFIDHRGLRVCDARILELDKPSILIAGCGTGQHSIGTASRFSDCKVLALDLSLSSLAYAKRKTEELGLKNIEHIHGDILEVYKLNQTFDIIETGGVLHHMDDPMTGWRALTDCLRTGGLMKIGLYSELARRSVVKVKEEIAERKLNPTKSVMKAYRNEIIYSNMNHHMQVRSWGDFFSLSSFRDLVFHVQEHRFSISQIKSCLVALGLEFCGFESTKIVDAYKKEYPNKGDLFELSKWENFEQSNPETFIGMYQFWCQKVT